MLMVLLTGCDKDPEIELVDIPDNTFLDALITLGVDLDGDGKICTCEAEVITSLNINPENVSGEYITNILDISDLTGIEAFIYLDSLDVSANPELRELYVSQNQLSALDVSDNRGLVEFYCSGNPLTTLDISNNTALGWVYLREMLSLIEVCVWETPFPTDNIPFVSTEGSP